MSDNHEELRQLVDDVVATVAIEDRDSDRLWRTLEDLGLTRVGVDEARGGSGGSYRDLLALIRALGGSAVALPIAEAALAAWALSSVRAVDTRVLLAFGCDGLYADDLATLRVPDVPWTEGVDAVLVYDRDGKALLVDLDTPGVELKESLNLAGERRVALSLRGAVGTPLPGASPMDDVHARYRVLRAAQWAGAAAATYELTREYVRTREQFGKPLARIPAVATALASMKTALVSVEAAIERAADIVDRSEAPHVRKLAAVAVMTVAVSEAAPLCARAAHQLHGAMGVTREYSLHHYTKRLWAWADELGTDTVSAAYLAAIALDEGESAIWDELTA